MQYGEAVKVRDREAHRQMSGTSLDEPAGKDLGIIFTSQSPVCIDAKPPLGVGGTITKELVRVQTAFREGFSELSQHKYIANPHAIRRSRE